MGFPGVSSPAPNMSPGMGGLPSFGGSVPTMGGASASPGMMQDRESRKQMIEDYYVKILGRKPKPNDLNYFLNTGITEAELIKKMVNSQEHADIIKAKKELEEINKKVQEQETEILKLKASNKDQRAMLENLNKLMEHKNQAISQLEQAMQSRHGVPASVVTSQSPAAQGQPTTTLPQLSKSRSEKFFDFLSKRIS
jgi:chromosome segregation ATPase